MASEQPIEQPNECDDEKYNDTNQQNDVDYSQLGIDWDGFTAHRARGYNANEKDVNDTANPEKKEFWHWGNVEHWCTTTTHLYHQKHFPQPFHWEDENTAPPDFPHNAREVIDTLVCSVLREDVYFSRVAYDDLASEYSHLQQFITLNMAKARVANAQGFAVDNTASESLQQWADVVYHFWQSAAAALEHTKYQWTEDEVNGWNHSHEMWALYEQNFHHQQTQVQAKPKMDVDIGLFCHKFAEKVYDTNKSRDALFWNGAEHQYTLQGMVGGQTQLACGKVYRTALEGLDQDEATSMSRDVVISFQGCHDDAKKRYVLCTNATLGDCQLGTYTATKGVKIHKGFRNLYNEKVHQPMIELIKAAKSDLEGDVDRFIFVGHSMGGALATLAAAALIGAQNQIGESIEVMKEKIYLCTFGAPAVGNYAFEQVISKAVDYNQRVHFWVDGDTVPHLPLQITFSPDKAKGWDASKHVNCSYSTLEREYKLSTEGLENEIIGKIHPRPRDLPEEEVYKPPEHMSFSDYHDTTTYYLALLSLLKHGQHDLDFNDY